MIVPKTNLQVGVLSSVSHPRTAAGLRYCADAVVRFCLSIMLLNMLGTARGQPAISYQIEGLLTTTNARVRDAAGTPKITTIPFRTVAAGANWKFMVITDGMTISTVGGKPEPVKFKKTVSFDGENIFLSLEPTTAPEKTIVTILDHTNFVKAVDIQPECVIWIATCSKQYFSNLGTNQCFAPFSAFGSTREGFFKTEVERMEPSGLPSSIKFQPTSAGLEKLTKKGKTDRLIARDLPVITEFYALSYYASQYRVLDTSEFQGFLLPRAFQLEEYYSTNGNRVVAQTYSGVVTNTTSSSLKKSLAD